MRPFTSERVLKSDNAQGVQVRASLSDAPSAIAEEPTYVISRHFKAVRAHGKSGINEALRALDCSYSIEYLLRLRDPDTILRLHVAVQSAIEQHTGSVLIARIPQERSSSLLRIRPTREGTSALLSIEPIEGYPLDISPEYLKSLFGLATSEAEIAIGLANGHDATEIAILRGVKKGTVRDQIKALLRKMGLCSQKQLLVVLSRLSDSVRS